jgi:hypothetical protein
MAESLPQAFEFSIKQSIITHYGPLPVICCTAQTYLLWRLLQGKNPIQSGWKDEFFEVFIRRLEMSTDSVVQAWSAATASHQVAAWQKFHAADFGAKSFSPFGYNFHRADGYCLLTLQIAVWAAEWSLKGNPIPTPTGFPSEPFAKAVGPSFGATVALIGHDSDTYGAAAFPLIAAAHGHVPPEMTEGLLVNKELVELGFIETS